MECISNYNIPKIENIYFVNQYEQLISTQKYIVECIVWVFIHHRKFFMKSSIRRARKHSGKPISLFNLHIFMKFNLLKIQSKVVDHILS